MTVPLPLVEVTAPRPEDLRRLARKAGLQLHLDRSLFQGMVSGSRRAASNSFLISCQPIT
ncbi:hypothetical protein P0O15_02730 [Methanotrichaceae archaeon Mx]|uniref:Uncharacterized protein n=2 Tax=Candidatus Methanocrinis natronophilus TaxID=3033396 RepID=A0ABT5X5W4_9EURY|nr:hypothetical protein [Candidatus Methanocrinis natronophilus]